jgi:hypothetical protein
VGNVLRNHAARVGEGELCFAKTHAVLEPIAPVLRRVPLEPCRSMTECYTESIKNAIYMYGFVRSPT